MEEAKKQKTKKILNIVVNVLVVIVLAIALMVTISNIASSKKGYTNLFGSTYVVVQSGSMDAPIPEEYKALGKQEGFAKGDLLRVKLLKSDEDKSSLEVGDIITFFHKEDINGDGVAELFLDSHRIVRVSVNSDGETVYKTKGDANPGEDGFVVTSLQKAAEEHYVVGVVKGNLGSVGKAIDFFRSSTGFLVCIVVPSFLVVIYFAFNLTREIVKTRKAGAADREAELKEKLMAELRAQGVQIPADMDTSAPADGEAEKPSAEEKPSDEQK